MTLWLQAEAVDVVRRGAAARGRRRCSVGGAARHGPLPHRGVVRVGDDDGERGGVSPVPRPRRGGRRRAAGRGGPKRSWRGSCSTRAGTRRRRSWSDAAVRRLEPSGDSRELAFALNVAGWYRWRRGRYEEAEPLLRRAVEIAGRVGRATRAGRGHDGPGDHPRRTWVRPRWRSTRSRGRTPSAMEVGHAVGGSAGSTTTTRRSPVPRLPERAVAVLRAGIGGDDRRRAPWQFVAWITGSLGDFEFQLGQPGGGRDARSSSRSSSRGRSATIRCSAMRTVALGMVAGHPRSRGRGARGVRRVRSASSPRTRSPRSRSIRELLEAAIARARGDRAGELERLRARERAGGRLRVRPRGVPRRRPQGARGGETGRSLNANGIPRRSAVFPASRAAALNIEGLLAEEPADQVAAAGRRRRPVRGARDEDPAGPGADGPRAGGGAARPGPSVVVRTGP